MCVPEFAQVLSTKSFSEQEAKKSDKSYKATQELLKEIEHKAELIDRGVQFQQDRLMDIINKILDKFSVPSVNLDGIPSKEITEGKIKKIWDEEVIDERMDKLERAVESLPKIHIGTTPPENLKDGDFFLQILEDDKG